MKNDKEKFKKEFKKRIYQFISDVIKFIDQLPKNEITRVFVNQILRSCTSIGANYIEAQASSSRKDFTNFFHHALKSANETMFWLCLLRDTGKCKKEDAEKLLKELKEISKIFGSSIITLKGKR